MDFGFRDLGPMDIEIYGNMDLRNKGIQGLMDIQIYGFMDLGS